MMYPHKKRNQKSYSGLHEPCKKYQTKQRMCNQYSNMAGVPVLNVVGTKVSVAVVPHGSQQLSSHPVKLNLSM